jgi:hypothetical protein
MLSLSPLLRFIITLSLILIIRIAFGFNIVYMESPTKIESFCLYAVLSALGYLVFHNPEVTKEILFNIDIPSLIENIKTYLFNPMLPSMPPNATNAPNIPINYTLEGNPKVPTMLSRNPMFTMEVIQTMRVIVGEHATPLAHFYFMRDVHGTYNINLYDSLFIENWVLPPGERRFFTQLVEPLQHD